jgi:hypothetical protein
MKKIQIALGLVALGFIGLVIYQNMGYLSASAGLQIDFWIAGPFHTEKVVNLQVILASFFIGVLASYFWGLSCRFKNNQTIKSLNDTITALNDELSRNQTSSPRQQPGQTEV